MQQTRQLFLQPKISVVHFNRSLKANVNVYAKLPRNQEDKKFISVETGGEPSCSEADRGKLPSSGYLSTYIARERGVSTPGCPWRLQVLSGQTINLTLYDFATWKRSHFSGKAFELSKYQKVTFISSDIYVFRKHWTTSKCVAIFVHVLMF